MQYTAQVWLEEDWWVAQAVEVDVASQGRTKEEARRNLQEALELYARPVSPLLTPQGAFYRHPLEHSRQPEAEEAVEVIVS